MLTRYSLARRSKRAWVHLTAARVAGRTLVLSAKLGVTSVLLWGFLCTEWVDGPPDLSLLRSRHCCIDSRESGVFLPSAHVVLCCGVSLPRRRYCLGFGRKGVVWPSAHTKPAVLNLPQPRYCHDSQRSGYFGPLFRMNVPLIKYSLLLDYRWCMHVARLVI